jgi:hypothetical protein
MCINPSEDLGIDSCSRCIETTQLVVQFTAYNQSVNGTPQNGNVSGLRTVSESHSYVLYVVIINDGLLSVNTSNYSWTKTIAPISKYEAAAAPVLNNNNSWRYYKNMFGGFPGMYKMLKKLIS